MFSVQFRFAMYQVYAMLDTRDTNIDQERKLLIRNIKKIIKKWLRSCPTRPNSRERKRGIIRPYREPLKRRLQIPTVEPAAEPIDRWKISAPNEPVELSLSKGKQRGRCWPSGLPFFLAATGLDWVGGGSCFLIFKYFSCWWPTLRAREALLTSVGDYTGAVQASGGAKLSHSPLNIRFTNHSWQHAFNAHHSSCSAPLFQKSLHSE